MASSERWIQFRMGLRTFFVLMFLVQLTIVNSVSANEKYTTEQQTTDEKSFPSLVKTNTTSATTKTTATPASAAAAAAAIATTTTTTTTTAAAAAATTTTTAAAAAAAASASEISSSMKDIRPTKYTENVKTNPINAATVPNETKLPITKPLPENNEKGITTSSPQSTLSSTPMVTSQPTVKTLPQSTVTPLPPVIQTLVTVESSQNVLDSDTDVIPPPNEDSFSLTDTMGDDDETNEPVEDEDNGNVEPPADSGYDSKSTKLTDSISNSVRGPHHTTSYGEPDDGDAHFFVYYLTVIGVCILMYVLFHNKQKILALIVEGRQEKRRRPNTNQYRPLDNNLEEVIQGGIPKNTRTTNIIY